MSLEEGSSVAGVFWSNSPVVIITSGDGERVNGQIAVTVVTSSIVHSIPRLMIGIWKGNYTHEIITASESLVVHLLRRDQIDYVKQFGFYTGREVDKFSDIEYKTGETGSPIIQDSHSHAECRVINRMDGGDMSGFLVDVVDGDLRSREQWMTLAYFYNAAPSEWIMEYEQKLTKSIQYSMPIIRNIDYIPFKL